MIKQLTLIAPHLDAFTASKPMELNRNDAGGKKARQFAIPFQDAEFAILPEELITHDDVVELIRGNAKTVTVCAAILAWGGMRYNSRDDLIKGDNYDWLGVCENIRNGTLSRRDAFDALQELRKAGKLKGLGVAFFTKLIYFLQLGDAAKKPGGYIMDQWASESVNLLTGEDVVRLDTSWTLKWTRRGGETPQEVTSAVVSDLNDGGNYEDFCLAMDKIAIEAAADPAHPIPREQLDRAVMGADVAIEGSWRSHLLGERAKRRTIAE